MKPAGLNQGARIKRAPARPLTAPEAMRPAPAGKAWTVRPGAGSVNIIDGVMNVPEGENPEDRHVRIHELLHARVTNARLPQQAQDQGVSWPALQGCEDGRLGLIAQEQGLDAYTTTSPIPIEHAVKRLGELLGAPTGGTLERPRTPANLHIAATLAMAAIGTALDQPVRNAIHAARAYLPTHEAWALNRVLDTARDVLTTNPHSTLEAAKIIDQLRPPNPNGETDTDSERGSKEYDRAAQAGGNIADPNTVAIDRPPLPIKGATARRARRTLDGGRLTHPTETLNPTGGAPFTRRRKSPGGVVVIDVSGSMDPTHADVLALVQAAPAALIVTYSNRSRDGRTLATVVGENGRVVAPADLPIGGGNRNDASVLAWADLNGPPGPRVWVSDGIAGNQHGAIDGASVTHAQTTAQRLNYTMVPSIPHAHNQEPA